MLIQSVMKRKTIEKAIDIAASRDVVWEILTDDRFTPRWYGEFSLGARPDTTWEEGSKVLFTDLSGGGLVGEVLINQPNQMLSIEYQGVVFGGEEDYTSEDAMSVKGGEETYLLTDEGGQTQLNIKSDIMPEYFDSMSVAWGRALEKIKLLSEEV